MPISGLLITLDRDPARRSGALAALRQHDRIVVGKGQAHRVPVVVDTPSSDEDRAVWDWLHEQPGISFVDVVYVHFDDEVGDRSETPNSPSFEGGGRGVGEVGVSESMRERLRAHSTHPLTLSLKGRGNAAKQCSIPDRHIRGES